MGRKRGSVEAVFHLPREKRELRLLAAAVAQAHAELLLSRAQTADPQGAAPCTEKQGQTV